VTTTPPDDAYLTMLHGAAVPTAVAGAGCVGLAAFRGRPEALGAVVGVAVVVLFFGAGLLVMRRFATARPEAVMAVAMLTYVTKVGLLGLALLLLAGARWMSGTVFGVTVMVCTAVWLAFELRAFVRMRKPVYDLDAER
jgi:ATP synthase protein I